MQDTSTFFKKGQSNKTKKTVAVNLRDLKKIKDDTDKVEMPDSPNGYFYWGTDFRGRAIDSFPAVPRIERAYIPTENAEEAVKQLSEAGIKDIKLQRRTIKKKKPHLPTREELADFGDQFVDIYDGGTPIIGACRILADAAINPTMAKALNGVVSELKAGSPLDEAFAVQADEKGDYVFPLGLIAACQVGIDVGATPGMDGGKSREALSVAIEDFVEGQRAAELIRSRIVGALRYPLGVFAICVVLTGGVLYALIPKMKDLYLGLFSGKGSTDLPFVTQILITASDMLLSWYGIITVALLIAATIYTLKWSRTEAGQNFWANPKLHLPIMGKFFRKYHAAETLRLLALLSAGGQPISERFLKTAQASSNRIYRERLEHYAYQFSFRPGLLAALFKGDAFLFGEGLDSQLVAMATSGNMQVTFHRYARTLEKQANRQLEKILQNIETYAIIPICVIIGFIVIALYSPVLELGSRIK